jgi:hypothetical protein
VETSSTGKIAIKNIPETPVIEAEVKDLSPSEVSRAFRLASRYVALAKCQVRYPVVLIFPDWHPSAEIPRPKLIYLQMALSSYTHLPDPKEKGLRLTSLPASTVVALSKRGAYDSEDWLGDIAELQRHLAEINLPSAGYPRRMLYHNTDITPAFWRLSEVQIPIPTLN